MKKLLIIVLVLGLCAALEAKNLTIYNYTPWCVKIRDFDSNKETEYLVNPREEKQMIKVARKTRVSVEVYDLQKDIPLTTLVMPAKDLKSIEINEVSITIQKEETRSLGSWPIIHINDSLVEK